MVTASMLSWSIEPILSMSCIVKIKVGDRISEGDLILILEDMSKIKLKEEKKLNIEKEFKKIKIIKPETEQTQTKEIKTTSHDISSASPKARKFARELGVDISQVVGSEKDGRIRHWKTINICDYH